MGCRDHQSESASPGTLSVQLTFARLNCPKNCTCLSLNEIGLSFVYYRPDFKLGVVNIRNEKKNRAYFCISSSLILLIRMDRTPY